MTSLLAERALRIKKATGDESTFEDSLAAIGRSSLSGKAPALANHEIGFQVLDKDEDNTRAVGVFGYRVGKKLLYIPMFYRDGVVKGTEQLRDPRRKITVPCSDNWINKFMGEKGDLKPDRVSRTSLKTTNQPSLWQLKYPPTKWAGESTWAEEARADLALAIGRKPRLWDQFSTTDDLVKLAGEHPRLMDAFAEWYTKYAWFADAVRKFYPADAVEKAVKSAAAVKTAALRKAPESIFARREPRERFTLFPSKQAAAKTKPAVSVVRVKMVSLTTKTLHPDMDFDKFTRHELESGRNVYKDFRKDDEVSDADVFLGGATAGGTCLHNPSVNGIYEVIGADNAVHKCAVLVPLLSWGQTQDRCLIVRLKDGAWTQTNRNAVWVMGEADKPVFRDWVHTLPKVEEGKYPTDEVVAISMDETDVGTATAPMRISEGGDAYSWGEYSADESRPYWAAFSPWLDRPDLHAGSRKETARKRVSVMETMGRPYIRANHLYLPSDSRWLKLSTNDRFRQAEGDEPDRFLLWTRKAANEGRAFLEIRKTASALVMGGRAYADRNDLEEALILRHGFKVAAAREFTTEALKNKAATAAVKYARDPEVGFGLSHDSPTAPSVDPDRVSAPEGFADDILPTVTSSSVSQPIPDMQEQTGAVDRMRAYPTEFGLQVKAPGVGNSGDTSGGRTNSAPDDDVAAVADAARTGRKELFDTAALAALVKHTKLRSLLDKITPHMLKQVTDMGDILAHMAWNTEEWSDQFGRSEIGPLEDQVRDLFDGMGDLYLTLQEKSVAGDPDLGVLPEEPANDAADSDQ